MSIYSRNSVPARFRVTALIAAALAILPGGSAVLINVRPVAAASSGGFEAADFGGTWNWMFNEKAFATMTLVRNGDHFSGSISNSSIDLDGDGKIASATAVPGTAEIVKTSLEGETLHIVSKDGDETTEWVVTLKTPQLAEVRVGGPGVAANFPPIRAEKAK